MCDQNVDGVQSGWSPKLSNAEREDFHDGSCRPFAETPKNTTEKEQKKGPGRHLVVEKLLEHAARQPVGGGASVVDDGERQLLALALRRYSRDGEVPRIDGDIRELGARARWVFKSQACVRCLA